MKITKFASFMVLLCSLFSTVLAQYRTDPLNDKEIDELRDAAQVPETRIKLYIEFARDRLTSLEQMRADAKVTDKAQQTHDKLQNFLQVYDELNDNIDTFVKRRADLRKPLKSLIEADTEFQAKLRALKTAANASPQEAEKYQFLLANALDAVDSSRQDHQQLLDEQETQFKHKKK